MDLGPPIISALNSLVKQLKIIFFTIIFSIESQVFLLDLLKKVKNNWDAEETWSDLVKKVDMIANSARVAGSWGIDVV